ncbi:YkvA family protein [Spongiactinospora sp. TRM90649]|uniref:YkvA family protein n=1 Tax=Spongiactinospora sp. TRM90649 TaxID=3031114 RepID=UPI0023F7A04E|nr:YkvA family protein [Spongiactinospora sp. TRM90649]MDF5756068.1 YkvA family protein [Spongiactinospora sp. TRM90649]
MAKVARGAALLRAYREGSRAGSVGPLTRLRAVPRLVGSVLRGTYPGMAKGKLAMMGLGVVYMISPIDVIPDFLLLIGVADDFGVFLWLMTSLLGESGRFVDWERTRHGVPVNQIRTP